MGGQAKFERVVAAEYERTHAGYAPAAVEWLDAQVGLREEVIVDLAAGTGQLTRLLKKVSSRVVAVEPFENMVAVLTEVIPGVSAVRGTAEEIPLADASAHCVTVAGSFHLFAIDEAAGEIRRVLRPGGALALLWKEYDMDDPIQVALDRIARPYLDALDPRTESGPSWPDALSKTGLFERTSERRFVHDQVVEADDLASILTTATEAVWLPQERLRELVADVGGFVKDLPKRVTLPGTTHVFVYSKLS